VNRKPHIADRHDAFAFATVGMAAATGTLPMDVWAAYLVARRPVPHRRKRKKAEARR